MIREVIVTTVSGEGKPHVAPFGLIKDGNDWIIAPFRPSTTLDNLCAVAFLVANYTDDVRVFAGCLTGRREWACVPSRRVPPPRLACALSHAEMEVVSVINDAQRPRFRCRVIHRETHAPFEGLNRARAAIVEGAILVSRLSMLPREKVEQEISYLQIAVDKTGDDHEREAWSWLMSAVRAHYGRAA